MGENGKIQLGQLHQILATKTSTARSIEIVPRGGPPYWLMADPFLVDEI